MVGLRLPELCHRRVSLCHTIKQFFYFSNSSISTLAVRNPSEEAKSHPNPREKTKMTGEVHGKALELQELELWGSPCHKEQGANEGSVTNGACGPCISSKAKELQVWGLVSTQGLSLFLTPPEEAFLCTTPSVECSEKKNASPWYVQV